MKLSVLVPLYNEEEYVGHLLERVIAARLPEGMTREIIVADDGSKDGSVEVVRQVAARHPGLIRILIAEKNGGKCSAIRRAIAEATGDISIIQDADLEYDPNDYYRILKPIADGRADAVFGSRFLTSEERRVLYFWHSIANGALTTLCNMFCDLNLTDMETCYKAVRTPLLKSIPITSERFGLEPEITIKLAKRQARIYEVPISYHGRTYEEGKKIGLKDAFEAFWVILKYSFFADVYTSNSKQTLDSFSEAPRFNRWMADTIRQYLGNRVLEIGAGVGNLTRVLAPKRQKYIATDSEAIHLDHLRTRMPSRPNLEVAELDASRQADFAAFRGQVDTVVCLNVLEHIEDDLAALCNIRSTLADGGRAIVLVPEGQALFGTLDEGLGHFRRYSAEQLRNRMLEAGFEVEAMIQFNRISRPGWWFNGKILKRKTVSRFQLKNFDKAVWLFRRFDDMMPWNPTSVIAIGRKRVRATASAPAAGLSFDTGSGLAIERRSTAQ